VNIDMKTAVICLAGPTASGKTAAALAIAQRHDVEIISVDSALVYRGMDIGTAKPTPAELAAVPHHLIDIRDPLHAFSAADFVRDAQVLIADITARGKLPLLVGGTMLYFKALLDGIDDMPKADPAVRAALEREAAEHGWPALHAELARVDPVTAARLNPADTQRVQRALEVFRISGQPMSFFHKSKTIATHAEGTGARGLNGIKNESGRLVPADGAQGSSWVGMSGVLGSAGVSDASGVSDVSGTEGVQPGPLLISLEPQDRAWLHARIAQRFDTMLAQGFLDEVRALRARGDLHPDLPSMRCVGYRQAWEALDGTSPMAELRDKGVFATRQLAKRQITWLRSMPLRQVVACDAPQAMEQVLALVQAFVARRDGLRVKPAMTAKGETAMTAGGETVTSLASSPITSSTITSSPVTSSTVIPDLIRDPGLRVVMHQDPALKGKP